MKTTTKAEIKQKIINSGYMIEEDIKDFDSFTSLGYDSLDLIDLVVSLETEFNITIDDSEIENCKTVNDLYTLLRSKNIEIV